jgi:hypothetical protein
MIAAGGVEMAKREYEEGCRTATVKRSKIHRAPAMRKGQSKGLEKQGQERLIKRGEERKNRKNRATYKKPQGAKVDRWAGKRRKPRRLRSWRELGTWPKRVWRHGDNWRLVIGQFSAGTSPNDNPLPSLNRSIRGLRILNCSGIKRGGQEKKRKSE